MIANGRQHAGEPLSQRLLRWHFLSVLGTTEYRKGRGRTVPRLVGVGTPLTHNIRNNVLVVYDEKGRPWVVHLEHGNIVLDDLADTRHNPAAHVPHSEDEGTFLLHTVTGLQQNVRVKLAA